MPNCLCDHCRSRWGRPAGEKDKAEQERFGRYATPLYSLKGMYRGMFSPDFYGPGSLQEAERIHREVFAKNYLGHPHDPLGPVAP